MKHFTLMVNRSKDPELEVAREVEAFLDMQGLDCVIPEPDEVLAPDTDCILVLGGDGTVLQAARRSIGCGIPILGINLGTLGYLAEIEKNSWREALTRLIHGDYEIEERMMIQGSIPGVICDYALNDIVLGRIGALRILNYDVYVNGSYLNTFSADGIILSTPTGSTAYNLSAGGPIVEPGAQLVVMTPICPHTLNTRSIILSAEDRIEVEVGKLKDGDIAEAEADIDGNAGRVMVSGERMIVTKADVVTRLVKLSRRSFLETLHRKISG